MLTIETAKAYAAATLKQHGSAFEPTGPADFDPEGEPVVIVEIVRLDDGYIGTFHVWIECGQLYGEY